MANVEHIDYGPGATGLDWQNNAKRDFNIDDLKSDYRSWIWIVNVTLLVKILLIIGLMCVSIFFVRSLEAFMITSIVSIGVYRFFTHRDWDIPDDSKQIKCQPHKGMAWLIRHPFDTPQFEKDASPYWRGKVGEMTIAARLNVLLDERFNLINNLRIPNPKSRTGHTEIDLVCVGPYSVFIIEVKNVSGLIDVSGEAYEWPIRYPYSKQEHTMRNACRQARIQQRVLKQWMTQNGLDGYVIPCVVFPNSDAQLIGQDEQLLPIFRTAATVAAWISANADCPPRTVLHQSELLETLAPHQYRDEANGIQASPMERETI